MEWFIYNKKPLVVEKKEDKPKEEKIKIVILTSSTNSQLQSYDKAPTVVKIEEYCKKHNIDYYTVFADTAIVEKDEKGVAWIKNFEEKGMIIDEENTVIIVRRGILMHKYSLNLLSRLERMGYFTLNNRSSIEVCNDKYLTILKLVEAGVPIPKTVIVPNEKTVESSLEKIGGKFPVIVKTLSGTKGIGVFIVSEFRSLKPILQTIWNISSDTEVLIQEFIENEFDIRIHVLGDEVIASMKREKIEGDFRTNVSLGGKPDKYEPSDELKEIAIQAAKAVKCQWAGVDMMIDKKGNPYILEVNASPGTEGIEKVSGVKVVENVIEYIKGKENWSRVPRECGVKEMVEILGMGEFLAKFDTGNSVRSCSLDAQDIKIKDKTVEWKTDGKKYSAPIVEEINIKSNVNSDDPVHERVVIKKDVYFDGTTYYDVLFNLQDRRHKKSKILINKDFMKKSNVIINVSKRFLLSINPKKQEK